MACDADIKEHRVTEPSETDLGHLRRAFEIAREARDEGNMPFGCLLVGAGGDVLLEQRNQGVHPVPDATAHAEAVLGREAAQRYSSAELGAATLYTSAEPCAMCAGTMYWAGVGRVVFGLTEHELKGITGNHPDNPTMDLPCRDVFARGQRPTEVLGPLLREEALVVHRDFWDRSTDGASG